MLPTYSSSPSLAHQRAALAWQKGNRHQWVTAFYAARVVGGLHEGLTRAIAHDINKSVDTVERLAMASLAYRFLFRQVATDTICRNKLREARRRLGYSHFVAAWKALRKEIDPMEVMAELFTCVEVGAGVRVFKAALSGRLGGGEFAEKVLGLGEYRLPTFLPDSDLFRQAIETGHYRVVLVDAAAETVVVRYG